MEPAPSTSHFSDKNKNYSVLLQKLSIRVLATILRNLMIQKQKGVRHKISSAAMMLLSPRGFMWVLLLLPVMLPSAGKVQPGWSPLSWTACTTPSAQPHGCSFCICLKNFPNKPITSSRRKLEAPPTGYCKACCPQLLQSLCFWGQFLCGSKWPTVASSSVLHNVINKLLSLSPVQVWLPCLQPSDVVRGEWSLLRHRSESEVVRLGGFGGLPHYIANFASACCTLSLLIIFVRNTM